MMSGEVFSHFGTFDNFRKIVNFFLSPVKLYEKLQVPTQFPEKSQVPELFTFCFITLNKCLVVAPTPMTAMKQNYT